MLKLKRNLAIALTVVLIGSLVLAGCNNSQTSNIQSGTANNGRSFTKENYTVTVLRPEHPSGPINSSAPAFQQIEKVTGVKVDLQGVPSSDYETKKKTLISTNRIPDMINVSLKDIQDYSKTGIYLDVTPYLDKMPNLKKAMEEYPDLKKVMVDGKLYGMPFLDRVPIVFGYFPMIRTDILKELNMPMPSTFEELHQTLKKFKEVYPDSYPWTKRRSISFFLNYLAYAFGTGYDTYYEPNTGKYQYGPLYPEFKSFLSYMNVLFKEKLLDPNYVKNTDQIWQQNLSSGKSLFFWDNTKFASNFNQVLKQVNPKAEFDLVPVMKNDSGQKRQYMYPKGHLTEFYAISSKVEKPERLMKFLDWMYSEEGADITNYGVPGEHFTRTKDGIKFNENVLEQFKDKNDPTRALQSFLGTGYLQFNLYSDETFYKILNPDMTRWGDFITKQANEGIIKETELDPPFTPEETERLKVIRTKVSTVTDQNLDKFIMGDRPLSEYDKFVNELKDAGVLELEKIYNAANDRIGTKK